MGEPRIFAYIPGVFTTSRDLRIVRQLPSWNAVGPGSMPVTLYFPGISSTRSARASQVERPYASSSYRRSPRCLGPWAFIVALLVGGQVQHTLVHGVSVELARVGGNPVVNDAASRFLPLVELVVV